jgi:outer membrane protein OmpA-like peptidoglycan-associated protein
MIRLAIFTIINLLLVFSGTCQDLSGSWTGVITQSGNESGPFTLDIRINQVGNFLSGEIKMGSRYGYVVQKFRGLIYDSKILMNEFEVVHDSSDSLAWCLKDLKGYFSVDENKTIRTIEGPWTSKKYYVKKTYLEGDCPPGTFKISQTLSSKDNSSKIAVAGREGRVLQKVKSIQVVSRPEKDQVGTDLRRVDATVSSVAQTYANPSAEKDVRSKNEERFSKLKPGDKMTLSVRFEQSKSLILAESKPELDKLVDYLNTYPAAEIELLGYTDNQGDPARNLSLSFDRVNVIKRYLVVRHISATRISVKGLGSQRPVAVNNSEENRKLNRRVEMIIK